MKINDLQTITDDVVEAARSTLGTWTAAHAVVRGPSVSAENRCPLSTLPAPFNPPVSRHASPGTFSSALPG
jgi:hypothetical protein